MINIFYICNSDHDLMHEGMVDDRPFFAEVEKVFKVCAKRLIMRLPRKV